MKDTFECYWCGDECSVEDAYEEGICSSSCCDELLHEGDGEYDVDDWYDE